MAKEASAGGVVYTIRNGQPLILMILDIYGQWTLPKGHLESGETPEQAALREIAEEVGLRGEIECDLGKTRYQHKINSLVMDKTVRYYLVRAADTKLRLAAGEVRDAKWVPLEKAVEASGYANNRPVIEKAIDLLRDRAA